MYVRQVLEMVGNSQFFASDSVYHYVIIMKIICVI